MLYIESFFSLPVCRKDGVVLPHEQVVEELADLAVSTDIELFLDGNFGEMLHISLVVEKTQYTPAIGWQVMVGLVHRATKLTLSIDRLRDLLTRSIFEHER